MSDYAIGDVQGCYNSLLRLLDHIQFNEHEDRLWFVGDLINRGPQSLEVLRFIRALHIPAQISLGNHDLHFLNQLWVPPSHIPKHDTLKALLAAPDREELGQWLRNQSILCYDETLNVVMTHAGIAPFWSLSDAIKYANELQATLTGPYCYEFLKHMYNPHSTHWLPSLHGFERLRVICNFFTCMRFCAQDGGLIAHHKGPPNATEHNYFPWYSWPNRVQIDADIIFGHWSALNGVCPTPRIYALDTGCVWGGSLTALRLQDKQRFSVV